MSRYTLVPLLLFLLLLSACGDLENAGSVTQPDEPRPPEGAFGVSETFSGPYLGSEGPITDPADERILEVEPGGKFFVRALYESPSGITDITVSLINPSPEGLAGPLDPSRSFFTIGAPTSVSEPGGGCELTGEDGAVTCIYEVQVAEDAVNVDELEGAEGEFAYVFQPQATNAAGATSDEDLRGYVVIAGDGTETPETPEPKPEPQDCMNPVEIPDEALREAIRGELGLAEGAEITCEDLTKLTELSESSPSFDDEPFVRSLEGLQFATNLESLDIEYGGGIDLSPLQGLTSLTQLSFFETRISDISPLQDLTGLTKLSITSSLVKDIGPLQNLTSLTELDLEDNLISDIGTLENLTNLTTLNLSLNLIGDISPLQNLTNLTSLNLANFNVNRSNLSDISPLQNLTNLSVLDLAGNGISDISPLQNLTGLTSLNFFENNISDISPLQNLTGLISLDLSDFDGDGNRVNDLSLLQDLTELTFLDLGDTGVSDISPLQNLTSLTTLILAGNPVGDVSPLQNLTELTELVLPGTQISDVSPLRNLTKLTDLNLGASQISDISPLQNLTNLVDLNLGLNQISDISPLQNLTDLSELRLLNNNISDISPLVANEGLAEEDRVFLDDNPLDTCPGSESRTDINTLIERGVYVFFNEPESCQ